MRVCRTLSTPERAGRQALAVHLQTVEILTKTFIICLTSTNLIYLLSEECLYWWSQAPLRFSISKNINLMCDLFRMWFLCLFQASCRERSGRSLRVSTPLTTNTGSPASGSQTWLLWPAARAGSKTTTRWNCCWRCRRAHTYTHTHVCKAIFVPTYADFHSFYTLIYRLTWAQYAWP